MKQFYLIIVGCLLFFSQASANNLVISGTPSYSDGTKILRFNIQWDNSWSINSGPANWDGVWVFVKRQNCSGTNNWVHQKLSTTSADHVAKLANNSVSTDVQIDAVADGMGVFIRRIGTNVVGNVPVQTVYLKLDGSATGTNPSSTMTAADNFEVLGLEMVYVPQGPFYAGDGRNPNTSNFSNGTATTPYLVDASKQASGAGQATNYTNNVSYGSPVPLPASFPLGYNGFYCMKYEATVGIFVEFLNALTYDQQTAILQEAGVSNLPNILNAWFDYPNQSWAWFNRVSTVGVYNTVPAIFTAPYLHVAEGGIVWRSMTAFLDWSGLRPMTEFEFEKACRGSNTVTPGSAPVAIAAVANEYPWGTTTVNNAQLGSDYSVTSALGTNVEGPAFYGGWDGSAMRPGAFAKSNTNRTQSGATYYGIMDMAGNVWEQCVGGGGYDLSGFTTANGDGAISSTGRANVAGWPANGGTASGTIIRGGWYNLGSVNYMQTSDRSFYGGYQWNADKSNIGLAKYNGARGVRNFSY
jgi:formylglycine-generating enzyme required for sulfatase activity